MKIAKLCACVPLLFLVVAALSCAGSAPSGGSDITTGGESELPAEQVPEEIHNESVTQREDLRFQADYEFVPALLPPVLSVEDVGELSREAGDLVRTLNGAERLALTGSYREAFAEGLFRGLRLTGVLGGDMVHGWPPASPVTWVQNWRVAGGRANSWGVPSLVLAVRGLSHDRVFLVRGDILHAYGLGKGLKGANGAAGYGAPCGDEFLYQGRLAQRFDFGVLTFDEAGNPVFLPERAPSTENAMSGLPRTGGADDFVAGAFRAAWLNGIDSGLPLLEPDAQIVTVDFTGSPWILPVGTGTSGENERDSTIAVRKIHYQEFGGGQALFILTEAALNISEKAVNLPPYPRIATGNFLAALLSSGRRLEGADSLTPASLPLESAGIPTDNLTRALLEGIALYGIPLSSVLPLSDDAGVTEAQRFSRGWFRRVPQRQIPVSE